MSKNKTCVLVHRDTKRILCFCFDDAFADSYGVYGYDKHVIEDAIQYDKWAKKLREQTSLENAVEDHRFLERENAVRQRLRQQLRDRLSQVQEGAHRRVIEQALHTLDLMEERKKRYRAESFMAAEAFEDGKIDGEQLARKIILNE